MLVLAAIAGLIIALTRDGGGGASGTTTTNPLVVPDSSVTGDREHGRADRFGLRPITVASATRRSRDTGNLRQHRFRCRFALPQGAYTPEMLDGAVPSPDRQEGSILLATDEFAEALVAANPDWSGEVPEPNADGTLDFEMTGSDRVARVHVAPAAPSSGAVIVAFTIDYV